MSNEKGMYIQKGGSMKILKNLLFALAVVLTSVSLIQAQIDTSKSSGTGTGINSGKGNTGIDNTGSMGTNRTGIGTQDTSRTGMGTGRTGTGGTGTNEVTGGARTGNTAMLRTTLEDQLSRFMQAINNGDVNTALTFYTNDATLLAPDIDIVQGQSGIGNFWTKITQMGLKFDTLTTADVRPSSDGQDAHEIGRYFLKIERPGQAAVSEKGKFLVVWKLQPDNSWKIDTHIWNRSKM